MSKADKILFYSYCILKQKYTLGNEPWYNIMGEPNPDPLASDCSGFILAVLKRAGVLFFKNGMWVSYDKLFGTTRPTAHIMYKKCKIISRPTKFGHLGFHVNSSGVAKHVWIYAPHPGHLEATFESGDGTGQVAIHDYNWQMKNTKGYKVVWGELPEHDMGEVTPASGTPSMIDWPVMQKNSYSDTVRELKSILRVLGFGSLTLSWTSTGKTFGILVESAVKKAQKKAGLFETGVVDKTTITALQRMLVGWDGTLLAPTIDKPEIDFNWVQLRIDPKGKRTGMRHVDVKKLKTVLNFVFDKELLDPNNDFFYLSTEKVVKDFQLVYMGANEVDGVVGERTRAALQKEYSKL